MDTDTLGPLLGVWIICAVIGGLMGSSRSVGGGGGLLLGLLFGPLGLIIVAVSGSPSPLDRIEAKPAEPGWHDDPLGRFDARYFDGERWTQHVGRVEADGSRRSLEDPL